MNNKFVMFVPFRIGKGRVFCDFGKIISTEQDIVDEVMVVDWAGVDGYTAGFSQIRIASGDTGFYMVYDKSGRMARIHGLLGI